MLLLEIHFTHHVSALSLSCQIRLMFEAHWQMKAFPSPTCSARGGGGGGLSGQGDVLALKSLLRDCLRLKHPMSCRALKQLECMAESLLIRNQEESHHRRPMGKS